MKDETPVSRFKGKLGAWRWYEEGIYALESEILITTLLEGMTKSTERSVTKE